MKKKGRESKNLNLRILISGGRKQNTEIVESKGTRSGNRKKYRRARAGESTIRRKRARE